MWRKKWYVIGYVLALFILMGFYVYSQVDADSSKKAFFATRDLPSGSIIKKGDFELTEGTVLDNEVQVLFSGSEEDLIGKTISAYGVRKGRPLLIGDAIEVDNKLHEIKLVGDITIPEDAKVVNVILVYDERNFPGMGKRTLAENVPVKDVYNNQNEPIDMTDTKKSKVPKAISLFVTQKQMDDILENQHKGILYFTTIP